ncbi:conserved protein of unknown function [Tenacibaculum sp. 190130A14a]|uniref:TPR_REGION domain-containing protein n=1 Tax=Tenacibaculum polynesiense TaxID=3137857 RepID=A0ABP1F3Y9_9FLAO
MIISRLCLVNLVVVVFFVNILFAQTEIDSLKTIAQETIQKKDKLKILDELTKQMIRKNHKELVPVLKEYLLLAKELREYDLLASKARFLVQQYIMKGKNKEAKSLCDSLLSYKKYFTQEKSEAHILLKRGGVYFSELAYKKAIEDYQKSAHLFLASNDSIFAADAFYFSGQAYSNSGNFISAIKYLEKAHDFYEKLKDYPYIYRTAKELDLIYRRNGLSKTANEKTHQLIIKTKKYKSYAPLQFLYLVLSEEAIKANDLNKANKYLDSSKRYTSFITDVVVQSNNAFQSRQIELRLRLKEKNLKSADTIFNQILTLEKEIKHKKLLFSITPEKAEYFIEKGEIVKALQLLQDFRKFSEMNSVKNISLLESERLLSKVYLKLGNYKEALKHNNSYLKLKDSINKEALTDALAFHQARFNNVQKEKDIQKLIADKKISRSKRNTLVAILFSIMLIIFGIWWREKNKRTQLKKQVERNKIELNSFTHQLLLKSKEQDELKLQLEVLKDQVSEKETIHSIQELVNAKILTKDDWYLFKDKFSKVHPHFFAQINGKGYKLTKSEERLVALEKLGLDNNEIANMLGVSVDSIFISRYRLRKKISAPKEISLVEYLS